MFLVIKEKLGTNWIISGLWWQQGFLEHACTHVAQKHVCRFYGPPKRISKVSGFFFFPRNHKITRSSPLGYDSWHFRIGREFKWENSNLSVIFPGWLTTPMMNESGFQQLTGNCSRFSPNRVPRVCRILIMAVGLFTNEWAHKLISSRIRQLWWWSEKWTEIN